MAGEGLSFVYQNLLLTNEFRRTRGTFIAPQNKNIIFGKPVEKDLEGAREVVNSWKIHAPSKANVQRRDFRSVNKRSVSVKRGTSVSKDSKSFIKTEAYAPHHEKPEKVGNTSCVLIHLDDEFTYGHANKPSTPLNDLLANVYGVKGSEATKEIYRTRLDEIKRKTRYLPKLTRSTILTQENTSKKLHEMDDAREKSFKLKRFENVKTKLDTVNKEYVHTLRSVTQENQPRNLSSDVVRRRKHL